MKAIYMRCILFIISWFQYQRPQQERAQHQHWKDRLVSLLLMKIIVCWASAAYFQFNSQQFVRRLAEEILSYSSAVMLVPLALSYLTITCHIAYKTLSHVYFFNILAYISICGFNNQMYLHLSSFVWNAAQTTSWSGLSDRIYIHLECVSEGIYTWSFHDRIAIRSEKMHEVTRCKQPLRLASYKATGPPLECTSMIEPPGVINVKTALDASGRVFPFEIYANIKMETNSNESKP